MPPVQKSELVRKAAAQLAADFTTANVGGGPTGPVLTGNVVGETLFEMAGNEDGSGLGDRVQRGKEFIANENPTDDFANAVIWLPNALDDWGAGSDTITFQSDNPLDDATKKARAIGEDINTDPICLETALGGVTETPSIDVLTWLSRVTLHDSVSDALVPAAGNITIRRGNGTILGIIPADYFSATQEVDIFLAGTLDDTETIATAGVDPLGATWSRPRTLAAAISVANGGLLTGGSAQGVWLRLTVREGIKPSVDVEYLPAISGQAVGA